MSSDEVVVLALPSRITTAKHARSTLIMASIETLRKRGLFDAYRGALAAEHEDTLVRAIAGTWIPLAAASAHYAACDALGLTPEQQALNGRSTFDESRSTILGTAVRMARGAGITPWQGLALSQRFYDRGCDGGAVGVTRFGPKDAHVNLVGCPLLVSPYFRNGLRGLFTALVELFCLRAFVTEARGSSSAVLYHVQWA